MAIDGKTIVFHPVRVTREHKGELVLHGFQDGRETSLVLAFGGEKRAKEWLVEVTEQVMGFEKATYLIGDRR